MIAEIIIALALPILIIGGIAAIPGWFAVIWGYATLVVLCAFTIQDISGWSFWLAVLLGFAGGTAMFVVAVFSGRARRAGRRSCNYTGGA